MERNHTQSRLLEGQKFIRRSDLTPFIRLYIACTALLAKQEKQWGVITQLARQYLISRTFVYMLVVTLEQTSQIVFGEQRSPVVVKEEQCAYRYMVSLRLEGRCSIGAISTIMKRFDVQNSSTGKISQTLHDIGGLLSNTLCLDDGTIQCVVFLSDELFANRQPILVTVEPQSSAILRIELADTRQCEVWKAHWECLEDNGYHAIYVVCDGGQALSKAQKEALPDVFRQPDTYHAIAHVLGKYITRLEDAAYAAIGWEEERWKTLDSARSDTVIEKRIEQYVIACQETKEKIDRYEDYAYLYRGLIEELQLFDETGQLRNRQEAEGNIEAALELLDTLGVSSISEAVKKVRRTLPDLLTYFDVAQPILSQLKELPLEQDTLCPLCMAWQWQKCLMKAKSPKARRYCSAQEQWYLELAAADLHEDDNDLKEHVYRSLDQIVQSSSLVECINSIIRPYVNTTKNHVTQELLNLMMFYHNHRRYKDGKRQGNTPMEILTGTLQEHDWLDLLFEEVEKKQPDFFDSSR